MSQPSDPAIHDPSEPKENGETGQAAGGSGLWWVWLVAVLLLAAIAGGIWLFRGNPQADSELVGSASQAWNRIAFIDPQGRLGTVSPDGDQQRMLSTGDQVFRFPAWSPQAPEVAAIGEDSQGGGLYVTLDQSRNELKRLYEHPEEQPIYLYWSPDGTQISFIAQHREGIGLHVLAADGTSGSQVVATGETSFFWQWYPDSEKILIHTGFTGIPGADTRMAFIPVSDAEEVRDIEERGYFQAPAASSDGLYYAFGNADLIGNRYLVIQEIERGLTKWIEPHQGVLALGWSPTKPQLAYVSPVVPQQTFYGPLRVIDMESGQSQLLTTEPVLAFFWSPDGSKLAYLTLESLEQGELVNEIQLNLGVVDVEASTTRALLTFQPSNVFVDQFLPFFDNYALSHRLWSPDSQALVIPQVDQDERNQIVVVPAQGGEPRTIADGVIGFWSHQ